MLVSSSFITRRYLSNNSEIRALSDLLEIAVLGEVGLEDAGQHLAISRNNFSFKKLKYTLILIALQKCYHVFTP